MAHHDRERRLTEQKREESRSVPPAVQELEVASERHVETEEPSEEEAPVESSSVGTADVAAPAASEPSGSSQGESAHEAAAATGG